MKSVRDNQHSAQLSILEGVASAPMASDRQEHVQRALATLEALAETWVEQCGIAPDLLRIPVNCPTEALQVQTHALILRFVKLAYIEGFYNGRRSIVELWDEK